jgi:heme-degrading monooxygenase HmoA
MYIAMNRFSVAPGREAEFAEHWRARKSYLGDTPGFVNFKLLEGEHGEERTIFISHATWESRAAFVAWTDSEQFKQAHRQGRMPEGVVLRHPDFEGYEVVEERVS